MQQKTQQERKREEASAEFLSRWIAEKKARLEAQGRWMIPPTDEGGTVILGNYYAHKLAQERQALRDRGLDPDAPENVLDEMIPRRPGLPASDEGK